MKAIKARGRLLTTAARRLLGLIFACSVAVYAFAADETEAIHKLMTTLYENGQFNGSIVVARDGAVIYRNAFGEAEAHQKLTPATAWNLASVSKQFTATAVMILAERSKINYDDPISKFIPKLAKSTEGITVRHLLTHTSGIPDIGDLGIDHPGLKESEVLNAVIKQHAHFSKPGGKYRYSNAGYILLAMIIEKVSGKSFGDFMQENIFKPLGMSNSYSAGNSTKGDGGVYSTADDLLKWDQALYTEKPVRQSTLADAFVPFKVQEGVSSYGFGWNVAEKGGDKYVWHTGNTKNCRAFIGRMLREKLTVIMLTRGNSRRMEISDAILNILHGMPYAMPRLSIAAKLSDAISKQGIDAAIQMYHSLKATHESAYDFSESELNVLGYELLNRGDNASAIRVFELNTEQYPASSNAFDSLGEAYQKSGNKELAIKACKSALDRDPNNLNARRMLRKLQ